MKNKSKNIEFVNPQDELVESLEGIFLVDAGAGTGKTHTIIRRYNTLVEKGVKPDDILLITFTNVAASQMKEDVISKVESGKVSITELLEAPVMTFHALCSRLLQKSGGDAPSYFGINEVLSSNFNVMEDSVFESELFKRFYIAFRKKHKKRSRVLFLSIGDDFASVLEIIKKLCSAGIFPHAGGWIENGEARLNGDFGKFSEMAIALNVQKKNEMSKARDILVKSSGNMPFDFDPDLFCDRKTIFEGKLAAIFEDSSRSELIEFIRLAYHEYIIYLLKRNQLSFEFLVMFAYLKLLKDDMFRQNSQYEYVMVDEFQDTDKIQFKLMLLLCRNVSGNANLMVVGDWRQGIYGFRNTTIENITGFHENIRLHKANVNAETEKISYSVQDDSITKIAFEYNYRSSQEILNFSRHALFINAKAGEDNSFEYENLNFPNNLKASRDMGKYTDIGFFQAEVHEEESETGLILEKIRELVSDPKYMILEFDKEGRVSGKRRVKYSDIAVLSRTKAFCIKLQKDASKEGIPVTFDGGLEIFASKQGVLVLAWLRLLLNQNDKSAVTAILENEGYDFGQVHEVVSEENILLPVELSEFRNKLIAVRNNLPYLIEAINNRYGFKDEFAISIMQAIDRWIDSDLLSLGEIVRLIENSLLEDFGIELNKTYDSVTCRTIHGSKGLEYPVVIVSNVNKSIFPDFRNTSGIITYDEVSGLRIKKVYGEMNGYCGLFDNWRTHFVNKICRDDNSSESRRLLYVALTRAKQYLYVTSYNPSVFFTGLSEATDINIQQDFRFKGKFDYTAGDSGSTVDVPNPSPVEKRMSSTSVKRMVKNFHEAEEYTNSLGNSYYGLEYGKEIHLAAFRHASGKVHKSASRGEKKVKEFIDSLNALSLEAEVDFSYPKDGMIIRGTIDLIAHYDGRILVVDYKTDKNKARNESYEQQVRLYIDAVKKIYKDKEVSGMIFYVGLDEKIPVK